MNIRMSNFLTFVQSGNFHQKMASRILLMFCSLLLILIKSTSLEAQNVSRNPVTTTKSSPSLTLTTTISNAQQSMANGHIRIPQRKHDYYLLLEPKRLSFETKAEGNHRLLIKRNENSLSHLNNRGKIWELPSIGQQPNHRLMQVAHNRLPTTVYEPSIQAREPTGDGTSDIFKTNMDSKCQRRSLSRMVISAKNLLTSGMEQYASRSNLILGSSLLAAAIPLAVLVLPESRSNRQRADSTEDGSIGGTFSIQARVDSVMGWVERSVEHLPNFPRLHPQECVKRSICEAHNDPDRYGMIGFILRLFFPATNHSSTDRMDNMEYKVINKYRHAAGYGLNKRIESNGTSSAVCKEKYEDCLVSLLEVFQNLLDIFLRK